MEESKINLKEAGHVIQYRNVRSVSNDAWNQWFFLDAFIPVVFEGKRISSIHTFVISLNSQYPIRIKPNHLNPLEHYDLRNLHEQIELPTMEANQKLITSHNQIQLLNRPFFFTNIQSTLVAPYL